MPYIIVSLEGQASAGGFLKIDGGSQIPLSDDLMIEVTPGTHYLDFSSQSSAQRGMANLNAMVGNYRTAAWAERNSIDGKITERFSPNSIMLFTVVSDSAGHILDLPTYQMNEVSDEKYAEMTELYNERIAAAEALAQQKQEAASSTSVVELLLCLFLGAFGAHKFYRGQFGKGLLYLFTGGLFGIGWLIDIIKCVVNLLKSR